MSGDGAGIVQTLLHRSIGSTRALQVAGSESRLQGAEILRRLYAPDAGTRCAFGQNPKSWLSIGQITGPESLRELLKLRRPLLVHILQAIGLVHYAAGKDRRYGLWLGSSDFVEMLSYRARRVPEPRCRSNQPQGADLIRTEHNLLRLRSPSCTAGRPVLPRAVGARQNVPEVLEALQNAVFSPVGACEMTQF
jgi:hypothetical protein